MEAGLGAPGFTRVATPYVDRATSAARFLKRFPLALAATYAYNAYTGMAGYNHGPGKDVSDAIRYFGSRPTADPFGVGSYFAGSKRQGGYNASPAPYKKQRVGDFSGFTAGPMPGARGNRRLRILPAGKKRYSRRRRTAGSYMGRRNGGTLVSVPRRIPIGPVPNEMVVKLQLSYNRVLNSTAGTRILMQLVGNSHDNPIREAEEGTGVANNQAYGYNELENFYHKYKITGCSLYLTAQQVNTTTNLADTATPKRLPLIANLWAQEQDTQTMPTTASGQTEYGAQRRMLCYDKNVYFTSHKSTRAVLGPGHDDIEQTTGASADPNDTWMWVFDVGPIETVGASETWECAVDLKMVFIFHFFDKKTLTQSTQ